MRKITRLAWEEWETYSILIACLFLGNDFCSRLATKSPSASGIPRIVSQKRNRRKITKLSLVSNRISFFSFTGSLTLNTFFFFFFFSCFPLWLLFVIKIHYLESQGMEKTWDKKRDRGEVKAGHKKSFQDRIRDSRENGGGWGISIDSSAMKDRRIMSSPFKWLPFNWIMNPGGAIRSPGRD